MFDTLTASSTGFNSLLKLIRTDEPLMFDTETIGLYGRIRLAQFYQPHLGNAVILEYPDPKQLAEFLDKCWVVCHNASYDLSTIQQNIGGVPWRPERFDDTLFLARLYYPQESGFTLDDCYAYATGQNMFPNPDKKAEMQKSDWGAQTLTQEQLEYAAKDVIALQAVWEDVKEAADDLCYKLDILTLRSNLVFQCNGMPVDADKVAELKAANDRRIAEIALPINSNSFAQVRPYIGSDSSDDLGLARLCFDGNQKAKDVRETRKLLKTNSFLKKYKTDSGLIYGKFSPSARSGRSTCSKQNLQQLPRATKGCFGVAGGGPEVMLYSDFSQLELRCACSITGDKAMEALYRDGKDIHTYAAERLFHTDTPTKEQRQIAKTCNFNLLYGGGAVALSNILLCDSGILLPLDEVERTAKRWKDLWPQIKQWQFRGFRDWKSGRLWSTPLGRKYLGTRMTDQLNIQVQGMGSEVAKLANHYMEKRMREVDMENWQTFQRNFIHDSYIFVLPNDEKMYKDLAEIVADSMQEAWVAMSKACSIPDLPMPVKVEVGWNWGEIENGDGIIYTLNK